MKMVSDWMSRNYLAKVQKYYCEVQDSSKVSRASFPHVVSSLHVKQINVTSQLFQSTSSLNISRNITLGCYLMLHKPRTNLGDGGQYDGWKPEWFKAMSRSLWGGFQIPSMALR